jgi:succinylglutamate desuccinylase
MSDDSMGLIEAPRMNTRVLGRVRGESAGPTFIGLAGIHGNEGAGVEAARRVLARFEGGGPKLCGDLVLLAGNLTALSRRARFVDHDLNRQWTPEKVAELLAAGDAARAVEHGEQRELLEALREVVVCSTEQIYFLDMHTCSADGPPFMTVGDTLRNRRLAQSIPLPLILGLEEQVDGALLELLNNHGFVTMGVEAGQHDAPASVDHLEAVLWLAIAGAGLVRADAVPGYDSFRSRLAAATNGAPRIVEVRHRHPVQVRQDFRMEPGFTNFMAVRKGQVLAHERGAPVRARETGMILLPLYQGLGNDGFFLCREVRPFWLSVSWLLRRLRLNGLVHWLPGVRRDRRRPEVLIVNTRVARIYPLEIFHLLGFRKIRQSGTELLVIRRRFDLRSPSTITFP